ncbi:hypothetical protein Q7P37_008165 [Cladosporium fusiforme]
MAETAGREKLARRPSFRKSLAEAGLPQEYLDQLEQKRKQLDESIHKYIAAKEREYRQFEKDLRSQHRAQTHSNPNGAQQRRQPSAEEAQAHSPLSAVDTLLRKGSKQDSDNNAVEEDSGAPAALVGPPVAGLNDRRTSDDRQEFVGVFTPQFLPALETSEDERTCSIARTVSAPEIEVNKDVKALEEAMHRANSDTVVLAPQAHAKRPTHLHLSHRTSSSGSSVEGKLISAMKSPSDNVRPKRKRVSLAVGDSIVAPSDNVPLIMSNNSTPSHSRTRTRITPPTSRGSSPNSGSPARESPQQFVIASHPSKPNTNGSSSSAPKALREQEMSPAQAHHSAIASSSKHPGDDIGEFWHMEEPDEDDTEKFPAFEMDDEFEEDIGTGIAGRVSHTPSPKLTEPPAVTEEEGLYIPEQTNEPEVEPESETEHLEFRPESVSASQQPTNPGFRRPSVIRDPGYTGSDYTRAALNAEETGIYGSSYVRPVSKGSFTAGSLGESYMARHAEEMMRLRAAKQDAKAQ